MTNTEAIKALDAEIKRQEADLQRLREEKAAIVQEENHVNKLFDAVLNCPHSITHESVTLHFYPRQKDGHNALAQLHHRLADYDMAAQQRELQLLGEIEALERVALNALKQLEESTHTTKKGMGGNWLTVVYRDIQPGDEARAIADHPKASALSWSHALHDRDAALAAQAKPVEDGWLQDGHMLYRLTDEPRPSNRDEIIVTMANSSRTEEARTRRAGELLDAIRAAAEIGKATQ